MGRFSRLGNDLYNGRKSVDFVGKTRIWYAVSGLIIVAAVLGLYFKGLNFGLEFRGGAQFTVSMASGQATQDNADKLRDAVASTGIPSAQQVVVTKAGTNSIIVETEPVTPPEGNEIVSTIQSTVGVTKADISTDEIGPSWGKEVAKRSTIGLFVFLILVTLMI
jgi:preprotein translocase subunit SecF